MFDAFQNFFDSELGLPNVASQIFWFYLLEAFGGAALLSWIASSLGFQVKKRKAYWIAVPLAIFLLAARAGKPSIVASQFPDFRTSSIADITVGITDPTATRPSMAGVTFMLYLRNTGATSAIDRPAVSVTTTAGVTVQGKFAPPAILVLENEKQVRRPGTPINPSQPVGRGVIAAVRVVCVFEELTRDAVAAAGTKLRIAFHDAFGRDYAIEYTMDGTGVVR